MSFKYTHNLLPDNHPLGAGFTDNYTLVIEHAETLEWFKQMVSRAFNVWDTAPTEAKEFADLVLHGKIQQDYKSMDQPIAKSIPQSPVFHPDLPWDKLPICPACGQRGVGHMATCPAISKK